MLVQGVDVVKDLLARRLPPFADGRPDVVSIQAATLREGLMHGEGGGLKCFVFPEARGLPEMTFTGVGNGNALPCEAKTELWEPPGLAHKVSLNGSTAGSSWRSDGFRRRLVRMFIKGGRH